MRSTRRLPLILRLYVIIPIWLVGAVLGLALLGTYTPQWRAEHPPIGTVTAQAAPVVEAAPVCGERTQAGNAALIEHAAQGGGFYVDPDACLDVSMITGLN